jgi:hypothetical protein
MADDETVIGKQQRKGQLGLVIFAVLPGIALWFGDVRVAFYCGFVAIIFLLNEAVGYLFDLAIRLSRTNELLVDGQDERRHRKMTTTDRICLERRHGRKE